MMKVQSVTTVFDSVEDPRMHEDRLNKALADLEGSGRKILKIDTLVAPQTQNGTVLASMIVYMEGA
jgi:hypothetical protein